MGEVVKDIINVLEQFAPKRFAESWDNCGLIAGDYNWEVNKVLLSLTPTMEVIDYAIANDVDMIITHHPYTISKHGKVNSANNFGRKSIKAIENRIAIYSSHTNLDAVPNSINDYLVALFGFEKIGVLTSIEDYNGYGAVCSINQEVTLMELAQDIKDKLGIKRIHYTGDPKRVIKKIALCSGSGMDFLYDAIDVLADVLITGDLRYHDAVDAMDHNIAVIDATHFGTENVVVDILRRELEEKFPQIEFINDDFSKDPIQTI